MLVTLYPKQLKKSVALECSGKYYSVEDLVKLVVNFVYDQGFSVESLDTAADSLAFIYKTKGGESNRLHIPINAVIYYLVCSQDSLSVVADLDEVGLTTEAPYLEED